MDSMIFYDPHMIVYPRPMYVCFDVLCMMHVYSNYG